MDNLQLPEPFLTGKPLEVWLDSMGIKDWRINNGLVDVGWGGVNLEGKLWWGGVNLEGKLGKLNRLPVRFGQVEGRFWCNHNQLVSLEGVPKEVGGWFSCAYNQLESLKGGPKEVGKDFNCSNNQLESLEGSPEEVGGKFWCNENQLVNLKGAPRKIGGVFCCSSNQLVSLEGAPKVVGGEFNCRFNQLVDFKGLEDVSIGKNLVVASPDLFIPGNVFESLNGLPKDLYSKVVGLDMQILLELERKRAASLLGAEVEELSSEVELG